MEQKENCGDDGGDGGDLVKKRWRTGETVERKTPRGDAGTGKKP